MLVEAQVTINGSKAEVWAALSDIANAADLISGIQKIEVLEKPAHGLVGLRGEPAEDLLLRPRSEGLPAHLARAHHLHEGPQHLRVVDHAIEDLREERRIAQRQHRAAQPGAAQLRALQAGAFEDPSEADNLKARLALMGVEASVQKVEVPDKGTMHRVRTGPYLGQDEMSKARQNLSSNGISTAVVKIKPKEPKPAPAAQ